MTTNEITASVEMLRVPCPLCGARDSRPERTIEGYPLERCHGCAMVFVNPRPCAAAIDDLYDHADHDELITLYARINTPDRLARYDEKVKLIESLLPGKGRLLDFACAAGYFHERALRRGWDAHGIDVGEWCGEAARRRNLPNLHVGTLRDANFPDGHFDAVNASQVFEHLADPVADLAELSRVLRPGGLLVADVPNYRTIPAMLNRDDFLLNTPPQHLNYFTPRTLTRLLTLGGFDGVRVSTGDGLKFENLLGKRTISTVADAYFEPGRTAEAQTTLHTARVSLASRIKSVVRSAVVKPLLYDGWKVGMLLTAVGRKPNELPSPLGGEGPG